MENAHLGRLIVFEGIDDVGKSTIASALEKQLTSSRQKVSVLSFPGKEDSTLGKWVYEFHHSKLAESTNETSLQLLHIAAHIDCISQQIFPRLVDGQIVILDRFWWSTLVYGLVDNVPKRQLGAMIDLEIQVWGNQIPDCLFWIRREAAECPPAGKLRANEYENLVLREKDKYPIVEIFNNYGLEKSVEAVAAKLKELRIVD